MEKCSQCNRHASLPFYVVRNGKLNVLCFACACNSTGLKLTERENNKYAPFVTG
jgi:hypothetical protein